MPPPPAYASMAAYPQPAVQARKTSGMAIASLVLGVIWIYWLGSILALVFGYLAKKEIRDSNNQLEGNGLATAGIVLGWVGVGTLLFVIGLLALGVALDKQDKKPSQQSTSEHVLRFNPPRELAAAPLQERRFLAEFRLPS